MIFSQPTDFIIDLSDAAEPGSCPAPSDFTVNGTPANSFALTNGNITIVFHFNTSPVVPGLNTMHIPACAFDCGNGCVQEFTCTFTYQPSTPTPTPTAVCRQVQPQHQQLRLLRRRDLRRHRDWRQRPGVALLRRRARSGKEIVGDTPRRSEAATESRRHACRYRSRQTRLSASRLQRI